MRLPLCRLPDDLVHHADILQLVCTDTSKPHQTAFVKKYRPVSTESSQCSQPNTRTGSRCTVLLKVTHDSVSLCAAAGDTYTYSRNECRVMTRRARQTTCNAVHPYSSTEAVFRRTIATTTKSDQSPPTLRQLSPKQQKGEKICTVARFARSKRRKASQGVLHLRRSVEPSRVPGSPWGTAPPCGRRLCIAPGWTQRPPARSIIVRDTK